jgi:hypothetical protein
MIKLVHQPTSSLEEIKYNLIAQITAFLFAFSGILEILSLFFKKIQKMNKVKH